MSATGLARLCAGGEPTFEPATQLDVFRPDGSLHQVVRAPDLTVLVWRESFADICTAPYASGTGTFMYTDNDVFVSHRRTNSFGFRINRDVTALQGGTALPRNRPVPRDHLPAGRVPRNQGRDCAYTERVVPGPLHWSPLHYCHLSPTEVFMSKRILSRSLLIGMGALAVSCIDRTDPDPAPPSSFGNRPASPGNSGLIRFQDAWLDIVFDANSGLLAIIGLQNTVADLCNDLGELDIMDFQIKPHQLGERNSRIAGRAVSVQVFAVPAEPEGDLCADFANAPVLYSGTGSFMRTDNNFTPTGTEGGRANSFGFTTHARLTDLVNGGTVQFSAGVRLLISPKNEFKELVSRITIGG